MATLRRHGELGRSELASASALTRSTLTDSLARLRAAGLIVERSSKELTAGQRGRPRSFVMLAPAAGLVAAVAVTWDGVQAAVLGFDGQTYVSRDRSDIVAAMSNGLVGPVEEVIDAALAQAGLTRGALACVILGLPAPVHPGTGRPAGRVPMPANRPGRWGRPTALARLEVDPARELADRLGLPVWVENDANLGAMGEAMFGAGKDLSDFVYLKVASGIGAGIVLGGTLHRGVSGRAGELAHLHVLDDGPVCVCGSRGCLATQFNSPGLVDLVQPAHTHPLTLEDVYALAIDGDPGVVRVLRDLGRTLGRSLADFCVYLNLSGIVLESVLGAAGEAVIAGIRESIERGTPPAVAGDVQLRSGTLGRSAELLGAVVLARQRYADLEESQGVPPRTD